MARPKLDKRRSNQSHNTRSDKKRGQYQTLDLNNPSLIRALRLLNKGKSINKTAQKTNIARSSLQEIWKKHKAGKLEELGNSGKSVLLSQEEEASVVKYCLYQHERGFNLTTKIVKSTIRDIHAIAVSRGEKRRTINIISGPSHKYMRTFFRKYPE